MTGINERPQRLAVIDTGTNSTRLLVAAVEGENIEEIERVTVITRLGEGVAETASLSTGAKARVEACVGEFAEYVQRNEVAGTLLMATSSVRDAGDGEEFIATLAARHGFSYRVLAGEEEARLAYRGAAAGCREGERVLMFDIGGGSTEIVKGVGAVASAAVSIQLGCVRIRERFLHGDPTDRDQMNRASAYIEEQLAGTLESAGTAADTVLAVAGTMTTLAALDLGLERYDRTRVHGHRLERENLQALLERLTAMTLAEKEAVPVMEKGRADVIVAGALIAVTLMRLGGFSSATVSENDILDGALLAFASGAFG